MIDEVTLRTMKIDMNKTYEEVMGLTLHTETKRAFLRALAKGAQINLDLLEGRNIPEEIAQHLEIIAAHGKEVDTLMRLQCDLKNTCIEAFPIDRIEALSWRYNETLEKEAPLERLAQSNGPPPPQPSKFQATEPVDPGIFTIEPPPESDIPF